jgi:hypothetical protein
MRVSKKYLVSIIGVGSLAVLTLFFYAAWVKYTKAQETEYKTEHRFALLREVAVTRGRVEELKKHIASLEEKAHIQSNYGQALRQSFIGNDGSTPQAEAKRLIADRDRLSAQTLELESRLISLKYQLGDLDR